MPTTEEHEATNAAESAPDLSIAEYRDIREGRATPKPPETPKTTDAPPAEEAAAETAGESAPDDTEESQQTEESGEKPAKKGGIQGRFSQLTGQIRDLQKQLAAEQSQRGAGLQQQEQAKPAQAPAVIDPADPEPQPEKFTDYTDWQKEWTRWAWRHESRQQTEAQLRERAQAEARKRAESWNERVLEAQGKHEDFATVAQNPTLPVTPVMAEAITDSEHGTEILYWLGKNPVEAARIAKLSHAGQARAIGAIEARLTPTSDDPATAETSRPTPVSQAPKPAKPLSGGTVQPSPMRNIDGMTQAEYRALRESGKIR
jgi:hypothetical protein